MKFKNELNVDLRLVDETYAVTSEVKRKTRLSHLRIKNIEEAKKLLKSREYYDQNELKLERSILELFIKGLSFNEIAIANAATKNRVVAIVRKLLKESYVAREIENTPRYLTLLRLYKKSGLVKDKLDLFILECRTKNKIYSTYKIATMIGRRSGMKRISRKALDLRLKRLVQQANDAHLSGKLKPLTKPKYRKPQTKPLHVPKVKLRKKSA